MKLKYAILTASFIGMAAANAATIAWTAGTAVTATTDISTDGAFVLGHNYGALTGAPATNAGGATATVNGVTFTQSALATGVGNVTGTQQNAALYTASADAGLNTLLDSNVWGADNAATTVSVGGLTENTAYLIQVLAGDERGPNRISNVANDDGSGSVAGSANTGTSFIGTFTTGVGETSVEFRSFGTNFDQDLSIAALQVRAVAVPEPSSTALLGLGGLALILRRRK